MDSPNLKTVSPNGETKPTSPRPRTHADGALQKTQKVRYLVAAPSVQAPVPGRDIVEVINRSINTTQNIVAEIKDILRGVEADVRAIETIQLVEEADRRTLTIQRKYRIVKDR